MQGSLERLYGTWSPIQLHNATTGHVRTSYKYQHGILSPEDFERTVEKSDKKPPVVQTVTCPSTPSTVQLRVVYICCSPFSRRLLSRVGCNTRHMPAPSSWRRPSILATAWLLAITGCWWRRRSGRPCGFSRPILRKEVECLYAHHP